MKRHIIIFLIGALSLVSTTSCLKEYLDKAPDQGLTDEQVFSKYDNFVLFFNAVYEGRKWFAASSSPGWCDYNIKTAHPLYFGAWDQKYTWETMTDAADGGRTMENLSFKSGSVSAFINKFTYDGKRRPILESMFTDIRICNKALANFHYLEESKVDPNEINDLKGQAYFIRAYCHFTLAKIWGPMPYIDKVIGPYDQWDIPRLSKHETFTKIAQDFDSAATFFQLAGKMRRDNGDLKDPRQRCPTGVAAIAFKARALLYAASPLNNENGIADWEAAASANWDAIQAALANKYALQTNLSERRKNFYGADYTNEDLWAFTYGSKSWNNGDLAGIMPGIFISSSSTHSGSCPTQNFVDRYETKWGEPLVTAADRAAATAAGHYNEQDMYANRDPRLSEDIIYNQQASLPSWPGGGKAQIWISYMTGSLVRSDLTDFNAASGGVTRTGYYQRKYSWGNSKYSQNSSIISDPLCRLAEVYLNYAEAANEAYGPNTPAPGANLTAVDAINIIRTRAGLVNVLPAYTGTKEAFRDRIKNERNIELSWEGHYYFDIRRWMDAPAAYAGPLYGVEIEKKANAGTYPQMYITRRILLSPDRQIRWKDAMYYLPFNTEDNFKMKNFVPNPVW